jgi:hypothetical protein
MKILKLLVLGAVVLVGFSSQLWAQTGDKNSLLQIAQGDKLVLKKDLYIPANTDRLYYGLVIDSGYKNSGCAIVVNPSPKSRKILSGGEIIFSGVAEQSQIKNEFKFIDYIYRAGVMNSETVVAIECYGTSFESNFQDLYVGGMKKELRDTFDFVPAEPEIVG